MDSVTVKLTVLPALVVRLMGSIPEITGGVITAQECVDEELLRGLGAAAVKSAALSSVSAHPSLARWSELPALLGAGAAPVPSNPFPVPNPTKSIIPVPVPVANCPDNAVELLTRATFPLLPDIFMLPVASGVGKPGAVPVPAASCTRKYFPAEIIVLLVASVVTCQVVPAADAY